MAIYKVQGPDGAMHELDGPEGATDEQIIAAAEEAFGSPQPEAPMPAAIEADKQGLQDVSIADAVAAPFMAADAAGEVTAERVGEAGYPKTGAAIGTALQMAPYAPAAVSALKAAPAIGETMTNGIKNYLSKNAGKFARRTAIEAMEPTTTNVHELKQALGGTQGVEDAGQYLLDQRVVTRGASAEDMTARLGGLAERAGRHVGETRELASTLGPTPTAEEVRALATKELAKKYGPGLRAGEQGSLNNALDELTVQNPQSIPELSQVATDMNSFAKSPRALTQPQEATTDVANIIARTSDEAVEKNLTGTLWENKLPEFAADKAEVGLTRGLQQITDRTASRDLAGVAGSTPVSRYAWYSKIWHTVMPLSRQASYADKISKAFKLNPQAFGRNAQALQRAMQAGKTSLNATIYMLQQQDPEFKAEFEEMNRQ